MAPPEEYSQQTVDEAMEERSVLIALGHKVLTDGSVQDAHAEGLLDMVSVWQQSKSVQLDVHGVVFTA